jgi:hypothetical protein
VWTRFSAPAGRYAELFDYHNGELVLEPDQESDHAVAAA